MTFLQKRSTPVLLREAKRPSLKNRKIKNKAMATFHLWKISIPFIGKGKKNKKKKKWSSALAGLYSPPSDLPLSLTTVLKGAERNFSTHLIYKCTSEKWLLFVVGMGNFTIKVSALLALILLYIQWLSQASYCNPGSFSTATKIASRYNRERSDQIMSFCNKNKIK